MSHETTGAEGSSVAGQRPAEPPELPELPALRAGRTLLVAESGDLERYNLDLRVAAARSDPEESAVFVTTETGAERMVDRYRSVTGDDSPETVGVVDAVSTDQSVPATYRETPTVYVPAPHELARLSLALSDLTPPYAHEVRRKHLVFQSLTPLFDALDGATVARFVRETVGESPEIDGFAIFRVDFTAHDEATMERLRDLADMLLWVEETPDGELDYEFERPRSATR
ncbi:hypothetical protein NGM10_12640 [Halorussus salilacus]|uniref:DUF7504 family protein n=1 Tax=Halorussus salilacus TaxID=2953750 RepID=UPI00209CDD9A|nr:hypothetical protein [Halorussus salilacus]USZ67571.1 hypothetical protein NGM10_12640 [Halorussus salilacus]